MRYRFIYFNHESFRGSATKLKKIVIYDTKVRDEHGRYAIEEEIKGCYGIHCSRCKVIATDPIVDSIKKFAIRYIRSGSH